MIHKKKKKLSVIIGETAEVTRINIYLVPDQDIWYYGF